MMRSMTNFDTSSESLVELPDNGSVRQITRWGEDVMHQPARPVETFDSDLLRLVEDMVVTMRAAEGVGLAACQIGVDLAVFVFDCPDADGVHHRGIVCNPTLELPEGKQRRLDDGDEGCLSFPGAFVPCARPDWARVTGVDHLGQPVTYDACNTRPTTRWARSSETECQIVP